jgi:hypothetical protein
LGQFKHENVVRHVANTAQWRICAGASYGVSSFKGEHCGYAFDGEVLNESVQVIVQALRIAGGHRQIADTIDDNALDVFLFNNGKESDNDPSLWFQLLSRVDGGGRPDHGIVNLSVAVKI